MYDRQRDGELGFFDRHLQMKEFGQSPTLPVPWIGLLLSIAKLFFVPWGVHEVFILFLSLPMRLAISSQAYQPLQSLSYDSPTVSPAHFFGHNVRVPVFSLVPHSNPQNNGTGETDCLL